MIKSTLERPVRLLSYKGCIGSIEYSTAYKNFYGTLQDIDDLIMYSADSVSDLRKKFREAVDEYTEFKNEMTSLSHPFHPIYNDSESKSLNIVFKK